MCGSGLSENYYHQMLKKHPSFSPLIPHEVQDKRQHFSNFVEEAEHAGENISNAKLKNVICDTILSETATTFRNKPSKKKLKM